MIQIDEWVIRVPGLSETEGRHLGQEVALRVAESVPEGTSYRHIPELNIQLNASPGQGQVQLAEAIAEQIVRQLQLTMM